MKDKNSATILDRGIKELLSIVLQMYRTADSNSKLQKFTHKGMCECVDYLLIFSHISINESILLISYFKSNKPNDIIPSADGYWWNAGNRKPRISWLKSHIAKIV